ncbi:hypothetical protein Psyaliredsea_11930 [Psychrobacter alimentarius]
MVVWLPLITVLMIWWIFSQTQITDLPIGVMDQDNGPVANTAVRYLEASPTLTVRQLYYSDTEAQAAILQRDVYATVVIPENFSRNILSGKSAPLVLRVNAQYGTHSGIIQTSVQAVAGTLSAGVEIQRLVKKACHQHKQPLPTRLLKYSVSACLTPPPIINSFWRRLLSLLYYIFWRWSLVQQR